MPNTENRKNSNKKPTLQEHSQTVIIPQLTPEMLEQARRAAEQGKTAEQIEQEALAAAQAEQKAVESKQEAPTAEKPKTVQPANKPKTRKEAEEELAQNIHDDHLWLNNPVMVRGLGLAPIVAAAVSGQNAWMLCAATILLITATRMLAVAICHLTGNRFRGVVYSYAAAIVYIPAYIILYNLFGADLSLLGIYLPMLVVEPAVIKRMESNDLETVGEAFRRGINNTIEAVLYCKAKGIGAYQGGTCNETDRSAQVCVQCAMATQPDQILAKPGMGVDEGYMIVYNEMQRILALRRAKKNLAK